VSRTHRRSAITEWRKNIDSYQQWEESFWHYRKVDGRWTRAQGFDFTVKNAHEWFKAFRDGQGRRWKHINTKALKECSKEKMRVANKRMCQKLKKDIDTSESIDYISDHHFKYLIWCFD
jgi:hypothetical protein